VLGTSVEWSAFIPIAALVFTVLSFWWIYLRRGRLRSSAPDRYAGILTDRRVLIRFPVVMFNSGAASIVVDDLRLLVDGRTLDWENTRRSFRPVENDVEDLAAPFAIAGRTARQMFVEFGESGDAWQPESRHAYRMQIEWKDGQHWRVLVEFDWWAPSENRSMYIAHRNAPGGPEESTAA
jgi:hypothetical protein